MTANGMSEAVFRGCHLAARHADIFHDAHDFADRTLCGRPLAGLSEGHATGRMSECPACARAAAEEAGGGGHCGSGVPHPPHDNLGRRCPGTTLDEGD